MLEGAIRAQLLIWLHQAKHGFSHRLADQVAGFSISVPVITLS
jgi:hypothetical protein